MKPREPKPLPDRAVSVMMTPQPKRTGVYWTPGGGRTTPWKQPTTVVLYFENHGLRRVYRRERDGKHLVLLNRRFHIVDMDTLSLQKPTGRVTTRGS